MIALDTAAPQRGRIPRVRGRPVVGNALEIRRDLLGFLQRVAREYGDIAGYRSGPWRAVLLNSPALIHSLLIEHAHDYEKGALQRYAFGPLVGGGLLTSEGPVHQRQRRLLAPLFQHRRGAAYAGMMIACAEEAQAAWVEGDDIDLHREMTRLTIRIVGRVLLGTKLSEEDELGTGVAAGLEWMAYAFTHPLPLPLWTPTPRSRRIRRGLGVLRRRMNALIAERRAAGDESEDLLSLLLRTRDEEGQGLSDAEVQDQLLTIFFAGHETMSSALSWALYLLAHHPAYRNRLQQEVDAVLAGRSPTSADLPRLPYTMQVFKETLRLYPSGAVLLRVALRDTDIAGYHVRKGTLVLVSEYVLHRRPDSFPDPERFDPERFVPEREQRLPRHAYIPFAAGHRSCIGKHLTLIEGPLVLATLAQRVQLDLLTAREVVPEFVGTLRPRDPIPARVSRRVDAPRQTEFG